MKIKQLITLALIPALLSSCGGGGGEELTSSSESVSLSTSESTAQQINVTMHSHLTSEDEYQDTVTYDDAYFLRDSHYANYDLALLSAFGCGAAYVDGSDKTGRKITSFLQDTGFEDIALNQYYSRNITLEDSIGVVIGKKTIINQGNEFTLLAVFPRNGGYGYEWYGDFNIGASGAHTGFLLARDEILRFMKSYINKYDVTGDVKVWTAGYSRGAAAAGFVAGYLVDNPNYLGDKVNITADDIYSYNIATPNCIPTGIIASDILNVSGDRGEGFYDSEGEAYIYNGADDFIHPDSDGKYDCIHNFVADGDFIPTLPPEKWDFTRYGKTYYIDFGSDEMISYLRELSPETADKFSGGKNYSSQFPVKTFDLETFDIVETGETISPEKMIENKLYAIMFLTDGREDYAASEYSKVFGALICSVMNNQSGFTGLLTNLGEVIGAVLSNYVAFVEQKYNLEENAAVANIAMGLVEMMGKTIDNPAEYNDQEFLKDLLDYLINDYQSDTNAYLRSFKIAALIPAPYGNLYLKLLRFAKDEKLQATTVDSLLYLLVKFITDNNEDEEVIAMVKTLAGLIPAEYAAMLPMFAGKTYNDEDYPDEISKTTAVLFDIFHNCAYGSEKLDTNADTYRYTLLSLVCFAALSGYPLISNLVINGACSSGETMTSDPALLTDFAGDVLKLALPKDEDGNSKSLKEVADESLKGLLEDTKNDDIEYYVDILINDVDELRDMLFTVLTDAEGTYSLSRDIENAYTFIDMVQFLVPAHYHELYICYLKTHISK